MSELTTGLAASANSPQADSPTTIDAALDAAFESSPDVSAASDAPPESQPAHEPAAATVQPPDQTQTDAGVKGEPPRERWDTILANARKKASEDTLAEHRDALEIVQRLKNDFTGTLAQLLEEGAGDPRFAEQLTSRAAAILSARNKAAKADAEPEPDAVMRYEDGTTEPSYSPAQLRKWNEWRERQMEKKLDEKYRPLQELQQHVVQVREVQQAAKEAASIAEERGATWKEMPFFTDHKDAILQRQETIYAELQQQVARGERRNDPVNLPWEALQRAYRDVISTTALPKLQTQQTDALVAAAARKRAGSASDPAASAPAQPRTPRTVDEALDQVFGSVGV